jgi:hypothetical protein
VFIAGVKTHGYGEHSHNAGSLFLAKRLNESVPGVEAVVHRDGWPPEPGYFDGASAVVIYMDGGDKHPMLPHLETLDALMKKGVGLAVLHYALVAPKGEPGDKLLQWIGGYYETHWSVNPIWTARFERLPEHPVTRGVRPFTMRDSGVDCDDKDRTARTRETVVRSRKGMAGVRRGRTSPGGRRLRFLARTITGVWRTQYRMLLLNGIAWIAGDIPVTGSRRRRRHGRVVRDRGGRDARRLHPGKAGRRSTRGAEEPEQGAERSPGIDHHRPKPVPLHLNSERVAVAQSGPDGCILSAGRSLMPLRRSRWTT